MNRLKENIFLLCRRLAGFVVISKGKGDAELPSAYRPTLYAWCGPKVEIASRVAQEFILAPDVWNASYGSLLIFNMPKELCLVDYAGDVATLIAGRSVELMGRRLAILMWRINGWMTVHGFSLALAKKNEVVILPKRRNCIFCRSASR